MVECVIFGGGGGGEKGGFLSPLGEGRRHVSSSSPLNKSGCNEICSRYELKWKRLSVSLMSSLFALKTNLSTCICL